MNKENPSGKIVLLIEDGVVIGYVDEDFQEYAETWLNEGAICNAEIPVVRREIHLAIPDVTTQLILGHKVGEV